MSIPDSLIAEFNFAALDNTENGIETGGLLCGDKESSTISTLIIPEQKGFATYFEVSGGEAEYCQYIEDRNLAILGFIHTHPTFSVFY